MFPAFVLSLVYLLFIFPLNVFFFLMANVPVAANGPVNDWFIGDNNLMNLGVLYGDVSPAEFLTLRVWHGGHFGPSPNRNYIGGTQNLVYRVPMATFDLVMMNRIVERLGHRGGPSFFRSVRAGETMDYGIDNLDSLWAFGELVLRLQDFPAPRVCDIYVEHNASVIHQFYPETVAAAELDHLALRIVQLLPQGPVVEVEELVHLLEDRFGAHFDPVRVGEAYDVAIALNLW